MDVESIMDSEDMRLAFDEYLSSPDFLDASIEQTTLPLVQPPSETLDEEERDLVRVMRVYRVRKGIAEKKNELERKRAEVSDCVGRLAQISTAKHQFRSRLTEAFNTIREACGPTFDSILNEEREIKKRILAGIGEKRALRSELKGMLERLHNEGSIEKALAIVQDINSAMVTAKQESPPVEQQQEVAVVPVPPNIFNSEQTLRDNYLTFEMARAFMTPSKRQRSEPRAQNGQKRAKR